MLVLGGCTGEPVLLHQEDFPGATSVSQNAWGARTPGMTWCSGIRSAQYAANGTISSWVAFGDHGDAGAALLDRFTARASQDIAEQAAACAGSEPTTRGYSIEPITGLDDGALGWTTRTEDGEWGQYALVPLDDERLLAVGFATFEDEAPVDLDDLIAAAREGAQQFPAERG